MPGCHFVVQYDCITDLALLEHLKPTMCYRPVRPPGSGGWGVQTDRLTDLLNSRFTSEPAPPLGLRWSLVSLHNWENFLTFTNSWECSHGCLAGAVTSSFSRPHRPLLLEKLAQLVQVRTNSISRRLLVDFSKPGFSSPY